ncbi:DUF6880 family protein [Actinoplanes awajinensis]|uniref:Uncharacterized protein n=1 Tax=Actinoplanes awajinensis subsp. mycoplanecinus TaxID=135947 RepID=A0A101JLQ1_9ACTN|nr:DUF6880 family protein [Actinoplanes awajinensis]KUL29188.1 hypothetical protein ADL15_28935 [Actinoplanes awajinensis subsp. mycoplanecinus]
MVKAPKTDLRDYLRAIGPDALVELVMELVEADPGLRRTLTLRAATHGTPDVKELRRVLGALRGRGFLPYGRSFDYARKAGEVLDALDVAAAQSPQEIGPLYRTAIQHLTKTTEQADDSSGMIGDAIRRAVAGYAKACRAAPPADPAELATWMIDFQVNGPGWPEVPIGDFADGLGESGLAVYWQHLTDLAGTRLGSAGQWAVRHLREEYLKAIAQDPDALVAVYAEELPQAYRYVQIGEVLRDAGRPVEAIAWLRRGLAEADRRDHRIDLLLAELLTGEGDDAAAAEVRWRLFAERPDSPGHRALLDAAERAGTLTEVAERANTHLHDRAAHGGYHADPLVQILLDGGDVDAAWAAAGKYQCSTGKLYQVAEERAKTHPADAIPAFAHRVEAAVDRKDKKGYAEAARLLADLRDLHERAGRDYPAFLAGVKETHARKTTFLATLAAAGL